MNPLAILGGMMFQKIVGLFVTKKRVIGWGAAVVLAVGAAATGMKTQEFKDTVCGADAIEQVEPAREVQ